MAGVKLQVTAGMAAWLVGATVATGLSLFAISHLGSDMSGTQGAVLSSQDVDRALRDAVAVTPSQSPTDGSDPAPSASTDPVPADSTGTPAPTAPQPRTSASASASPNPQATVRSARRQLSGQGGQVTAQCQGRQVYLASWSPAQGYQVGQVQRGPARFAMVVFVPDGAQRPAPMYVVCTNGTPAVAGDDGGYDH